jgi:2-amino-4-hydroxy-6-hydroxymethyldihydropteridine diphosphokinase
MAHVYLSIGSNLDDPVMQVRRAIETLRGFGMVSAVSPFYRTKPWGTVRSQPDFVNVVVALETMLSPRDLLLAVKSAEREFGRDNEGERYGPRVIDFDILTYDDLVVNEPDLEIPHPRMNDRAFVLVPLADLDPQYEAARDALPASEIDEVERFSGP